MASARAIVNRLPSLLDALSSPDSIVSRLVDILQKSVTAAAVMSVFAVQLLWYFFLRRFRSDVVAMRQGRGRIERRNDLISAPRLIGLAAFHSILAFFLYSFLHTVIFFGLGVLFGIPDVTSTVLSRAKTAIIALFSVTFFVSVGSQILHTKIIAPGGVVAHRYLPERERPQFSSLVQENQLVDGHIVDAAVHRWWPC